MCIRDSLLVVKGTFEQFGGAERDLLNNLRAWQEHFEITAASLHLPDEARQKMDALGILYLTTAIPWRKPVGGGPNLEPKHLDRPPIDGGTCWK